MISTAGPAGARPLRVALDTTYAGVNPTGVGLYSASLAAELDRQAGELGLDLRCYGPTCRPGGPYNTIWGTFQEWPSYTHGILPARLLAARPRVVHSTSHIGPVWGPGRLIVTVHDLIFMRYPDDYQRGWLALTCLFLPPVLRRATAIVADSQATKDDIRSFFGIRKDKIVVIYPGVSKSSYPTRPDTPDLPGRLPTGAPYILCLGPWVRRKNLEVVFMAFGMLAHEHDSVHLVITGETPRGMVGYTREELRSLVPEPYRDRVRLVGYVSLAEKECLIASASVLCYPSRFEGFGLPPLEAMSAGVPVVAADTPAVVETTGGAALIAGPDDPRAWAGALLEVLRHQNVANRLREAGIARAASFSWERCARQTARLYWAVAR